MEFMNAFVSAEFNNMRTFLQNISVKLLTYDIPGLYFKSTTAMDMNLWSLHVCVTFIRIFYAVTTVQQYWKYNYIASEVI